MENIKSGTVGGERKSGGRFGSVKLVTSKKHLSGIWGLGERPGLEISIWESE